MKKLSSIQGVALLLSLLFLFTNCSIYSLKAVIRPESIGRKTLGSPTNPIIGTPAIIIVHLGTESWQIDKYLIDDYTIKGELLPIKKDISFYYDLAKHRPNFIVKNKEKAYAKQLHLFVDKMNFDNTTTEISLSDVNRCEGISKNRGLMTLTKIPIVAGAAFGAFLLYLMYAWG